MLLLLYSLNLQSALAAPGQIPQRAASVGGGPGATLSLSEYRALFGHASALPALQPAPASLTPARRRKQEEEILMLLCEID